MLPETVNETNDTQEESKNKDEHINHPFTRCRQTKSDSQDVKDRYIQAMKNANEGVANAYFICGKQFSQ